MPPSSPERRGPARRALSAVVAGARRFAAFLGRTWRRSLHFRVISLTMLMGLTVVLAVGALMYQGIADGLVRSKTSSAQQVALRETADVQNAFDATDKTDLTTLYNLSRDSVRRISSPLDDTSRLVVLMRAGDNARPGIPRVSTAGAGEITPPADVRGALARDPAHQQTKIITLHHADGGDVPAVMVGSRVNIPNAGAYDLYLVFPMDKEAQSLGIVRNSFAAGGLGLVLLIGACAYLATRLVVTPVRSAAHVSERLAAGNLDERMRVRGEDDIARLATSFNAMASSLQRQIGQLEDLSHLQQRFTSDVSHELRTPLTTIRMAADMIHDSRGDFAAHVARSSELLSKELDRFEALLADLLEISRFDAGGAVLSRTPVSFTALAADVIDMHEQLAQKLGVKLVLDAPTDVEVPIDRRRVERILRNLVSNAIEHGQNAPVVVIVRSNVTAVSISVRDYGIGLKEGEADKVFDRFWRADPARARTTGGTGLGLSISLEDARLHDGFLEAWGAPGEGSCFRLTLPRHPGIPIASSPGPLQPSSVTAPKQIASGTMRTSDGGARLVSGYPSTIGTKKATNALPPTLEGEAVARPRSDE